MNSDTQGYTTIEVGTSRSFGVVFAIVFAVIGLWPLLSGGGVRLWSLGIAGVFLLLAFVAPKVLQPLNVIWFKFGMLLARIVNPVVMFIIYVITILPFGLGVRALGKDLLRLRTDPDASTYWESRKPPGPEPKSLEDQF